MDSREGQLVKFIAKTSQPAAPSSTSISTDDGDDDSATTSTDDSDDDPGPIHPRATDEIIIVTGARPRPSFPAEPGPQLPPGNTLRPRPIPARLEIREFINNKKMFSLYVQALSGLDVLPLETSHLPLLRSRKIAEDTGRQDGFILSSLWASWSPSRALESVRRHGRILQTCLASIPNLA
jgi:hypothetical protein